MKILVFHWKDITHPYAGGAERLFHQLMKETKSLGHSVIWFCSRYENSREKEYIDGINVVRRGGQFSVYLQALFFYLKNRKEIDLVIDNITGVPWFTPLYSSKPKVAIIYHVGGKETFFMELPAMKGLFGYFLALISWLAECMIPVVYKNVPFITFSEDTKNDLTHLGVHDNHIFVAQEGIALAKYKPCKEKEVFPYILYVGRLVRNKGAEHLIKALKIVVQDIPNARLSIVGRGYFEDKLKKLVEDLGLKANVTLHGYVSEDEKIRLLQSSNVLVMPSLREGFATPVIEAGACGTTAIGTDVTGTRSTIIDGVTGFLVPYGDVAELADKISSLLNNHTLRKRMGQNATEWAQRFDQRLMIQKFIKVLEHLVLGDKQSYVCLRKT
jgi:glycosyltransferase involved in cell wall biosynthesis